jgi:hypothetical protein
MNNPEPPLDSRYTQGTSETAKVPAPSAVTPPIPTEEERFNDYSKAKPRRVVIRARISESPEGAV